MKLSVIVPVYNEAATITEVARRGIPIHEVPIRYSARTLDQGKTISWKDGLYAIWTLLKYRFVGERAS